MSACKACIRYEKRSEYDAGEGQLAEEHHAIICAERERADRLAAALKKVLDLISGWTHNEDCEGSDGEEPEHEILENECWCGMRQLRHILKEAEP